MSVFGPGSENLSKTVFERIFKLASFMGPQYPDGMDITDTTLAGVPVRIYKPYKNAGEGDDKLAGLVYYHGGGWCSGNIGKNFSCSLHVRLNTFREKRFPKCFG